VQQAAAASLDRKATELIELLAKYMSRSLNRSEGTLTAKLNDVQNALKGKRKALKTHLHDEMVKLGRFKADLSLKLAAIDKRIDTANLHTADIADSLTYIGQIVPSLVEASYLQTLLDMYRERHYEYVLCLATLS
jgi:hypothetical protein